MRQHQAKSAARGRVRELGRREFLTLGATWAALQGLPGRHARAFADSSLTEASTSRTSREEAIGAIPFAKLNPEARQKIDSVVARPTLYRRMPVKVIESDPELYLFLIRYPEIIVNMWQLMGVTQVTLTRKGPYLLEAEDGAGTVSNVELVYGNRNLHVLYAEGRYEGPLLRRRLDGRCVLLLSSGYASQASRTYVTNRLDVFLKVDNVGADLIAKTLHPLVGKTADSNFLESAGFVGQVSDVAKRNGPGFRQLAERLTNVQEPVRERFLSLTESVYRSARQQGRDAAIGGVEEPSGSPTSSVRSLSDMGTKPRGVMGADLADPDSASTASLDALLHSPRSSGLKLRR